MNKTELRQALGGGHSVFVGDTPGGRCIVGCPYWLHIGRWKAAPAIVDGLARHYDWNGEPRVSIEGPKVEALGPMPDVDKIIDGLTYDDTVALDRETIAGTGVEAYIRTAAAASADGYAGVWRRPERAKHGGGAPVYVDAIYTATLVDLIGADWPTGAERVSHMQNPARKTVTTARIEWRQTDVAKKSPELSVIGAYVVEVTTTTKTGGRSSDDVSTNTSTAEPYLAGVIMPIRHQETR